MLAVNHSALAVALAFFLAGCGGSEVRISMLRDPMPPGSPDTEEDRRRDYAGHREYRNQQGLARIKANYAYARGATGEGITLGIVDTGIDPSHPKFEDRLEIDNVEGYYPDFRACPDRTADGSCRSPLGHGTYVGGIMAAGRRAYPDGGSADEATMPGDVGDRQNGPGQTYGGSGSAVHGVAFDARVISVGSPGVDDLLPELPENPTPEQVERFIEQIEGIESVLERRFASAFERLNSRVTAVNASLGLPGNIENFTEEELRERFPNVIEVIAQADTPAAARTVYVWAAGNAGGETGADGSTDAASSVEIVAGLPVRIPELRGHSLAVVATDRQGSIAAFSNRCGIAKAFCLAAPGVDVTGPVPGFYCSVGTGDCYLTLEESGTSAAAPFVTGGIALLAQHYRDQLGNDGIVARLLATADRTGAYADSDIYGQGFLDLDAATRPVGETRMLIGRSLSGPSALNSASVIELGAAFGDSLTRALSSMEVASFDELDAPFFQPLVDRVRPGAFATPALIDRLGALGRDPRGAGWRAESTELQLRLDAVPTVRATGDSMVPGDVGSLSLSRDFGDGRLLFGYRAHPGWRFGLHADGGRAAGNPGPIEPGTFTDDGAFANPWLGFARNGASIGYATNAGRGPLRVAAFHGSAQYGERRDADTGVATGLLTEYRFGGSGSSGLALQAGWLNEAERLAGSRPGGAFGELGADTAIAGLSAHREVGDGWSLLASAHAGMSRAEVRRHGMLRDPSALWTGSFSFGLLGKEIGIARDRLAVRLSQPLRVEAGHAEFRWVSGRTPDGRVAVDRARVDLEPSGRQLDLEVTYARRWAGGKAYLAAIVSQDTGHVRGERQATLLMRYSRGF